MLKVYHELHKKIEIRAKRLKQRIIPAILHDLRKNIILQIF